MVFVSLTTGYRKSPYYTFLPWIFDELLRKENSSIVLCVSPLTSLMIDQRKKFTASDSTAWFVGGGQDVLEKIRRRC